MVFPKVLTHDPQYRIKITSDLSSKTCVHLTEIFPEIAENALIGLTKLKIFCGNMTPNSPRKFAASPQTCLVRLQQSHAQLLLNLGSYDSPATPQVLEDCSKQPCLEQFHFKFMLNYKLRTQHNITCRLSFVICSCRFLRKETA